MKPHSAILMFIALATAAFAASPTSLPSGWQILDGLNLEGQFDGISAYCDAGQITILLEDKTFVERVRVEHLDDQMITDKIEVKIDTYAGLIGTGRLKSGKCKDGGMSYTLFYPKDRAPSLAVTVIIHGEPTKERLAEVSRVISFLGKQKKDRQKPNQAPEPTSAAVTPPAGAGDRASGARGSP